MHFFPDKGLRGPSRPLAAFALASALMLAWPDETSATAQLHQSAPDFTLASLSGSNLRLQEQRGNVVMLNFWATWCGPCRREMPQLNRLYGKYRDAGFVLLGVNVDEDRARAAGLAQKLGVQFPVLFDPAQSVTRLYDLGSMPATVLIDRDGRVRYIHRGYQDGTEDAYDRQIVELLKE